MSYKKIIAFGDSFTRGDELADCPAVSDEHPSAHSTRTWCALLAHKLGIEYDCRAMGGRGNQYIGWQIANRFRPDTLFIVNWTYFERFDYVDIDSDRWTTVHPRHDHKLSHYFFKHIDSEVWNTYRNLQYMHSAISLLKQNNIDFIMTCLDSKYSNSVDKILNFTNSKWNDAIEKLHEQVSPHITTFEKLDFLSWSKHNKYEIGAQGHPLEKAHTEAAKYINTNVIEGKNYGY